MRRIDLMYEKYPNNTVKSIKETMLKRCVKGFIKGIIVPNPCNIKCEECWSKELTEEEIKQNL